MGLRLDCNVPSIAALRHAPWSLSKIQCALRCPLEFHYRYVDRLHEPEVAPDTRLGKALHAALEAVLARVPLEGALAAARTNLLGDDERERFDALAGAVARFAERITALRARRRVLNELIEHRLAVAFDLSPVEFTARDAFFRGVWDVGYVFDDGVLAVVDHKTGVRRPGADYLDQLKGYATLAAAHMGSLRRVWLGLHFLVDASLEWTAPVDVEVIRDEYAPGLVAQIETAARAVATRQPRPSTWCVRCSFRSICPVVRAAAAAGLPETEPELVDDGAKE
jgi:CRISPR/Cas system-associated exonuclease Cas4 (RecB family)